MQLTVNPFAVAAGGVLQVPAIRLRADPFEQCRHRQARVSHHRVIDGGAPPDVARAVVDLDDLLALGIPVGVGEVGAQHEQQVAPVKRVLGRRVADEAALAHGVGVVGFQAWLGLEGQHHRRGQPVGELQDLGTGVARAVADKQRDPLGGVDALGRAGDCAGLGHDRHVGAGDARRRPIHILGGDVAGNGQHGDSGGVEGALDRLLDQARELGGAGEGAAEDRHVTEHGVVVDLLKEVRAQLGQRHLPADGQHRRMGLLGVIEAVEEMQRARAHRAHAHPQWRAELRLSARGKRAGLLVAHPDPLQAFLEADGVGDRVQRVADDAPHRPHAQVGDCLHDRLSHRRHHALLMEISRGVNESGSARSQSVCHESGGSCSSCPGSSHS